MTIALTYTSYAADLANLMATDGNADVGFQTALPNIINDAELRIYRDLDLLATNDTDTTGALSTGTPRFTLPSSNGTFVVIDSISVITPVGTTDPNLGTRNPLWPVSVEAITMMFPSSNGSGVPQYFARYNEGGVVVGPWPDSTYQTEVIGTLRPASLSSTVTTTILSVFFPDLFMAASMVFAAGYQKNFGAMVDDPKAAVSWETHYQQLLQGADVEEQRKRFQGPGWSPEKPSQITTPPRT